MEKLRHRLVYEFDQGYIAGTWQVQLHGLQAKPLVGNPEHQLDKSKAPVLDLVSMAEPLGGKLAKSRGSNSHKENYLDMNPSADNGEKVQPSELDT